MAGVAQNGKEALELMEEVHPDLVISDIKMPFMDGLELAKHIHEDYMNTKVILFSGWDDFEYARLAISYGVSEYIMKPINYEEMQNLLMKMHEELDKEYNEKNEPCPVGTCLYGEPSAFAATVFYSPGNRKNE
mgnify:CR=1 FL=1